MDPGSLLEEDCKDEILKLGSKLSWCLTIKCKMQAPEYFATAAVAWKPLAVPSSVQYQHLGDVGKYSRKLGFFIVL